MTHPALFECHFEDKFFPINLLIWDMHITIDQRTIYVHNIICLLFIGGDGGLDVSLNRIYEKWVKGSNTDISCDFHDYILCDGRSYIFADKSRYETRICNALYLDTLKVCNI